MNALTLAELKLRHAELTYKAERLRGEQRSTPVMSTRAPAVSRAVRETQERADDYARIIATLEGEQ